jgi:transposase InsO family protein
MRTKLVVDALEIAVWRRRPLAGLVHHSDRDAQYTAISFGKRFEEIGIVPSREGPEPLQTTLWQRASSPP